MPLRHHAAKHALFAPLVVWLLLHSCNFTAAIRALSRLELVAKDGVPALAAYAELSTKRPTPWPSAPAPSRATDTIPAHRGREAGAELKRTALRLWGRYCMVPAAVQRGYARRRGRPSKNAVRKAAFDPPCTCPVCFPATTRTGIRTAGVGVLDRSVADDRPTTGLGAGEFTGFYRGTGAAAHWFYRVHVARVADGLVLPHAPALVLSILTVVFCVFFIFSAAGRVVLQNGFFRPCSSALNAVERAKKYSDVLLRPAVTLFNSKPHGGK